MSSGSLSVLRRATSSLNPLRKIMNVGKPTAVACFSRSGSFTLGARRNFAAAATADANGSESKASSSGTTEGATTEDRKKADIGKDTGDDKNLKDTGDASKIEELELKLSESKDKYEELLSRLRYSAADAENARKRHVIEIKNAKQYAITKFAQQVVEVADNLERALEVVSAEKLKGNEDLKSLYEGVQLTDATLISAFEKFGIEKLNPLNEKFDPSLHEAMFQVDSDEPKNTVVNVMQNGWKIKDRVLRAARVGTSKGPQPKE